MKRTLVGALAALAVVAALPAPASAQDAEDAADAPALPAEFSVAAPRVGDAGSYQRSVVRFDGTDVETVEEPEVRESFRIEAPRDHYDADGRPHRVNAIHSWIGWRVTSNPKGDQAGEDIVYFVDAGDGELVASLYTRQEADYYAAYTYFPGLYQGPPLCGLANALQRGPVPLDGPVDLFPSACRRAHYVHRPVAGDPGFVAVRADPWGDGVAIGFQQAGTDQVVLAWFVADIPYPVRLLEQVDKGPEPQFALLDLVGFARGTQPVAGPGDRPALKPLPPVRTAPHGGEGPDESGVEHPYPWSEAWSRAQTDADVAAFLDQHPGARLSTAVYNELVTNQTTTLGWDVTHLHRWWFVLDDGRTAQRFDHDRTTVTRHALLPIVGAVELSSDTRTTTAPNTWDHPTPADGPYPSSIPVVADAIEWWRALASPEFADRPANAWLFGLGCTGCREPWGATGAGYLRGDTTDEAWRWEASYVSISHAGRLAIFVENVVEGSVGPPAGLALRPLSKIEVPLAEVLADALEGVQQLAGGAPTLRVDEADVALPLGAGDPRTPPPTASQGETAASQAAEAPAVPVALLAVGAASVAGAVGLGWLAMALFSRLRRDRALDHPVRRGIMDAIEADPGIHLRALVARTGKGDGVVRHHLAKLREAGLVVEHKSGGYACYFPTGPGARDRVAAPALKADGARRVLQAVAAAPGGLRPVAARAGLAPSTVEHHLARLSAAGLVRREGNTYMASPAGLQHAQGA